MKTNYRNLICGMAIVAAGALIWAYTTPRLRAQQQDQQNQTDQQNKDQQNQGQQNKDQSQSDQGQKKKGGIFGGLKSVTAAGSGQNKETASAGSKGAVDGKTIADKTPTAADKQQVTDMENYSVPAGDLKKFQEDGHLQPK